MLKNIFSVYTLLVCFVCTMVFIVTSSTILTSFIHYRFPEYKQYTHPSLDIYDTNENYLEYMRKELTSFSKDDPVAKVQVGQLEDLLKTDSKKLAQIRLAKKEAQFKKIRFDSEISIINQLPIIFMSVLFFVIHWGLYRKQKRRERATVEKGTHAPTAV